MSGADGVGLEDLFEGEPGDGERRRGRAGWWLVKAVVASAGLGAAVVVVLVVLGYEMSYLAAAAGIFVLLGLRRLVTGLGVRRPVRSAGDLEREPGAAATDGLAPAVHRWQVRMQRRNILRPSVAELVDERLRLRRGCTRAGDPERARTLLGERLWSYLDDPAARAPSPRDFAAMLDTVEEL